MEERKVLDLDDLYYKAERMCEYVNELLQQIGEKRTWVGVRSGTIFYPGEETFPTERVHLQITEKVKPRFPTEYEYQEVAICFPYLKEIETILWFASKLLQVLVKHSQEHFQEKN